MSCREGKHPLCFSSSSSAFYSCQQPSPFRKRGCAMEQGQDLGQTWENMQSRHAELRTACREGLQHTLPKPNRSSVGQLKKVLAAACLVSPYCTTQPRKMLGLAIFSGNSTCTRARGFSSRGTPFPCHSAPAALCPLLDNQGGWCCTASSRGICSSDRGM